ncbi:MAG: menaquinone-specific isochorismate synthase [Thermosynechococcus sp.]|uniref:isochorismate synthase n=1 Tax=Thermosynechococcus sp. TaxID=2814275 RepID=UPI00220C275F|nr:isochorismate synthase [Thermosynechococcus sp.]BCX13148.1 MAG: menaquinone-specific isochorismate synthase [Thermosynechococcus sp.]
MPVSLPLTFDLSSESEFYTQVSAGIQAAQQANCQFLSLGISLPTVDPLMLLVGLMQLSGEGEHFYLEQAGEIVAACGAVATSSVQGQQRFGELQRFSEQTLSRVWAIAPAEPRMFCQFSFWDHTGSNRGVLPRWQVIQRLDQVWLTLNCALQTSTPHRLWQDWQLVRRALAHILADPPPCPPPLAIALPPLTEQYGQFIGRVKHALKLLAAGDIEKLVLAAALTLEQPQGFNWLGTLQNLRQQYTNSYIFSVGQQRQQVFLGASPERLVKIADGVLCADALAGSRPRGQTQQEDQSLRNGLYHSPKERYEHQIIVEFLCQTLQRLGMTCEVPAKPRILELSHIQHLQTLIRAPLPQPIHILQVVAALHPTPAVAGYPAARAQHWLRQLEPFDRNGYAAPLGWVTPTGEGEFIVGIRSARLQGNHAHLFAGAGIVKGSHPEREWQEILWKFQTMISALA